MSHASGKHAYGISDRSGFRYKLNEMKREWNGLLVGPDEFEDKHPQLEPRRHRADAVTLSRPSPDRHEALAVHVAKYTVETPGHVPVRSVGRVGIVSVVTS